MRTSSDGVPDQLIKTWPLRWRWSCWQRSGRPGWRPLRLPLYIINGNKQSVYNYYFFCMELYSVNIVLMLKYYYYPWFIVIKLKSEETWRVIDVVLLFLLDNIWSEPCYYNLRQWIIWWRRERGKKVLNNLLEKKNNAEFFNIAFAQSGITFFSPNVVLKVYIWIYCPIGDLRRQPSPPYVEFTVILT